MGKILDLIHEWKNTLCVTSKYKEDLVHIRDMHRLLSYKGKSLDWTSLGCANLILCRISFQAIRCCEGAGVC